MVDWIFPTDHFLLVDYCTLFYIDALEYDTISTRRMKFCHQFIHNLPCVFPLGHILFQKLWLCHDFVESPLWNIWPTDRLVCHLLERAMKRDVVAMFNMARLTENIEQVSQTAGRGVSFQKVLDLSLQAFFIANQKFINGTEVFMLTTFGFALAYLVLYFFPSILIADAICHL